MSAIHVLLVEDSDDDVLLIVQQLRRDGIELSYACVQTAQGMAAALADRPPQLVICDYNMPSFNAQDALALLHRDGLDVPFILVSGTVGEDVAASLMKAGAHDFVLKHRLTRLVPAVQRELREAQERRRSLLMEAALRDSEERFRLLAEHIHDVIFRYRLLPEPGIDYISPAVTAVTGYTPEELRTDPELIFGMVDPDDRAAFVRSWHEEDPAALVVGWRRRDGRPAWIEQRAVGVCDERGQLVAIEGILRDVTENTLAARERERLDHELRQAERLDSLGQLAGGIAHDFNNLLAVIAGYAGEVIAELPEAHPCRADVGQIVVAADKAAALTRQLLIFSKLEPTQPEILDINDVVTEVEKLLRRTIGEDIEFITTLHPDLSPVRIDRTKLEQVIVNLVVNARAAMPHGGHLHIATADAAPGGPACLSVTDTGHGMSAEVARRVFEPFFSTKGPGRGTGLGLATAYGVIAEAGGTITVSSRNNQGTTFTILLPAADGSLTDPVAGPLAPSPLAGLAAPSPLAGPAGLSPLAGASAGAGGVSAAASDASPSGPAVPREAGRRILVVEDDDAVRDMVRRILTRAGYQVLEASTPARAIHLLADPALPVDAMITDVIMPEMSGPELVLHARLVRPDLPVLLMSGYTAGAVPDDPELAASLPLIRKPFSAESLLAHLRELTAER